MGALFVKDKLPKKYKSIETLESKAADITDIMVSVLQGKADIALADMLSCYRFMQEFDPRNRKLKNPFIGHPLQVFDCGYMIDKREKAFGDWIENQIQSERAKPDFLALETDAIVGWEDLIARVLPEGVLIPTFNPD